MSCAYRAFYAIRDLRSSSGEPTNAVYGFTNMLLKLLRERTPDAVAVVFDTPAPTFRHERFGAYKATRKPMPDDLSVQLPFIREVIDAYRIPSLQRDGVEADDLMASLAVRAAGEGYDVFLVTSDKDMLQLVGDRISVIRPEAGEVCDAAAVTARFGVEPAKVIEVLAHGRDGLGRPGGRAHCAVWEGPAAGAERGPRWEGWSARGWHEALGMALACWLRDRS